MIRTMGISVRRNSDGHGCPTCVSLQRRIDMSSSRLRAVLKKVSGCAGINRFGIENESILRRKFSQLLRPSAERRFSNRNCLKRPCKGKRRPAIELPPQTIEQGTTFVCRSCPDREKATLQRSQLARSLRTRRSPRTCACVDIPNARTGRSCWFPFSMGGKRTRERNGQKTLRAASLT